MHGFRGFVQPGTWLLHTRTTAMQSSYCVILKGYFSHDEGAGGACVD